MSIIGSNILAGASGQGVGAGYTIENSLRFRSSASAYLNRTPATAGNRKTWTWSAWVKRGSLGGNQRLFYAGVVSTGAGLATQIYFSGDNLAYLDVNYTVANLAYLPTTAVYRDISAWYHIVVSVDTTQATASNRVLIYVNGVQVTAFSSTAYMTQNLDTQVNSTVVHDIGKDNGGSSFFDGYMAEVNLIDGQALDPSSFGEYNEDTGVWQPAAYAGTYGTNGFYLPFSDATNTTTLVADSSGNGNDWTPNGISLTSGATYDSMTDTPTIYADGGNYAVLNPLNTTNGAVAQGNLYWSSSGASGFLCTGTIAFDIADTVNKYYFEIQLAGGDGAIGIAPTTLRGSDTGRAGSYSYYTTGSKYSGVSASAYGAAFGAPNIIGVAVGAGKITFYKNGVSQGDAFTGLTGLFVPMLVEVSGTFNANFGQRPFAYTPPTGFKSLHTGNLPDSAIVDGSTAFDAVLYTGNGTGQSITGLEFQPDFVWGKSRTNVRNHNLYDSVRGVGNMLLTNGTTQELTGGELTGFNTDGFTLGSNVYQLNASGDSMVAWNWKAGTAFSNDAGTNGATIASVGSVNQDAGFSIITYTGNSTAGATVAHGLNAPVEVVICKQRNGGTYGWNSWHVGLSSNHYIALNSTSGEDDSVSIWNTAGMTASVFTHGSSVIYMNAATATYVAYCFTSIEGYSKFGSYTGNGSADGTFVYLGFRPAFVMIKRTDALDFWMVYDAVRSPYNQEILALYPNAANAETTETNNPIDAVSNGFKCRGAGSTSNINNGTYIYMAFAENPFKNSLAR